MQDHNNSDDNRTSPDRQPVAWSSEDLQLSLESPRALYQDRPSAPAFDNAFSTNGSAWHSYSSLRSVQPQLIDVRHTVYPRTLPMGVDFRGASSYPTSAPTMSPREMYRNELVDPDVYYGSDVESLGAGVTPCNPIESLALSLESAFPNTKPGIEGNEIGRDEPYAKLLYRCLKDAPQNTMVLKDIYKWFRENTPKGQSSNAKGWQNSVRHNLSMNQAFYRDGAEHSGKKNFKWRLTEDALDAGKVESTTRYRKKDQNKSTKGSQRSQADQAKRAHGKRGTSGAKLDPSSMQFAGTMHAHLARRGPRRSARLQNSLHQQQRLMTPQVYSYSNTPGLSDYSTPLGSPLFDPGHEQGLSPYLDDQNLEFVWNGSFDSSYGQGSVPWASQGDTSEIHVSSLESAVRNDFVAAQATWNYTPGQSSNISAEQHIGPSGAFHIEGTYKDMNDSLFLDHDNSQFDV